MPETTFRRVLANDFSRQWEIIREAALEAVDRVGRSGWLVLGEEVREFEKQLAAWWGTNYAVGVASGLDALEIALRCARIPAGARVLTTPLTAFATTLAILRAGLEPVWCDVDQSGNLDLDHIELTLRNDREIKAILPVHLYGHPMDPCALERLADDHDVIIIEDCAQSAGAERAGRPTGVTGVAAGTSFYPTKNLGGLGDGGALLTNDPEIAEQASRLRDYGQSARYRHTELGLNSRLDELQAAILRSALLPRLDAWLARRHAIAERYVEAFDGTRIRPIMATGGCSAHHLFPVEVLEMDPTAVAERIACQGVVLGRHYPVVCPDQPAARGLGETIGSLEVARRLANNEISLPLHPHLDDHEVEAVINACLEAIT